MTGTPVVDPFPSTDQHDSQGLEPTPLPVGEALRAHLPPSGVLTIAEVADSLVFTLPESYESPPAGMTPFTTESTEAADRPGQSYQGSGKTVNYVYQRYRPDSEKHNGLEGDASYAARVKDIIVIGEGHSSWGEFKLLGRVRPFDGLLHLSKEYVSTLSSSLAFTPFFVSLFFNFTNPRDVPQKRKTRAPLHVRRCVAVMRSAIRAIDRKAKRSLHSSPNCNVLRIRDVPGKDADCPPHFCMSLLLCRPKAIGDAGAIADTSLEPDEAQAAYIHLPPLAQIPHLHRATGTWSGAGVTP